VKERGHDERRHADDYWNMKRTLMSKTKILVSDVEIVNWGRKGPNKTRTLNLPEVLKAADSCGNLMKYQNGSNIHRRLSEWPSGYFDIGG
jgi:hypothetical protein